MIIRIFDSGKNKTVTVGYYEDGIFSKVVSSNHFMRKENGFGIQEEVIQLLKKNNCHTVILKVSSNNKIYVSNFTDWLITTKKDYGYGLQRFLPITKFNIKLPKEQGVLL